MVKRRTIGPAYELSPAEKLSNWSSDHSLRLLAGVAAAVAFWIAADLLVNLINYIDSGGIQESLNRFSRNDPFILWTKIIGSPALGIFVATRGAK